MNNNFNNYNGYSNGRYFNAPSYNIPNYQQNYVQRPMVMEQQQPMLQQNGIFFNNIRYVSPEDMDKYIVGLGQTDMLINMHDGIVKIKSADMTGNSFTRSFEFKEINPQAPVQTQQQKQEIDLTPYVKKEDLTDFIRIDALTQLSKQIDDKLEKIEKKISLNNIIGEK